MRNLVADETGAPVRVYRGEHGSRDNGILQTRSHSFTFVKKREIALTYATSPNNHGDHAEDPRVIEANITIRNPVLNNPDDPFIDFTDIAQKLGRDLAVRLAIKHSDQITNTNNWQERYSKEHESTEDLLRQKPDEILQLYMDAYPLLDDPEFLAAARSAGYDGAIHAGNGASACEVEYRVFDMEQIDVVQIHDPLAVQEVAWRTERMRA